MSDDAPESTELPAGAPASAPTELPPGTPLPAWILSLERACFGEAWADRPAAERLWMWPRVAFARWSVVPAAGEAELLRVAVSPEARGAGVGRRLLESCHDALAAEGIRWFYLEVREGNAAARALYHRLGWRVCGRRPCYYPDGEDALLYGKDDGPAAA